VEGPLGEIYEPEPGRPHQGYGEVVGHDNLIPTYCEDGGGVDLQELGGVDHPVVLSLVGGAGTWVARAPYVGLGPMQCTPPDPRNS
jgi:hypothetical protein